MSLTTNTLPRVIIGKDLKLNSDYKFNPNTVCVEGQHIIATASGRLCLYMGDDKRKETPTQIIVSFFNGELGYLPIERKVGIDLVMEEH